MWLRRRGYICPDRNGKLAYRRKNWLLRLRKIQRRQLTNDTPGTENTWAETTTWATTTLPIVRSTYPVSKPKLLKLALHKKGFVHQERTTKPGRSSGSSANSRGGQEGETSSEGQQTVFEHRSRPNWGYFMERRPACTTRWWRSTRTWRGEDSQYRSTSRQWAGPTTPKVDVAYTSGCERRYTCGEVLGQGY